MILRAPAKVNLYLRVLKKRPDGYHDIETIFERIALFDKIVLRSLKKDKIKISCNHPNVPRGKKGLIYRAASLLKSKRKISGGAEIKIFKQIPVAAGLGGGSSDAASVLLGLIKLWRLSLGPSELVSIGKALGADIPFFIKEKTFAAARGRGDEITPLDWKAGFWHLLVFCNAKLFSKDIYSAYAANVSAGSPEKPQLNKILSSASKKIKLGDIKNFITNDLEIPVLEKEPRVARLKKVLKDIGLAHSVVSGSGPSVFSLFEKRKEAVRAKELLVRRFPEIKRKGWQIFIVPTL